MSIFDGTAGTPAGAGLSSAATGQGVITASLTSPLHNAVDTGQYVISNAQMISSAQQAGILNQRALLQARQMELEKIKNLQNLDAPAWQASLSTLENAWLAKFGSEWVDGAQLVGDEFFAVAAQRLVSANRLERHVLTAREYPVYRIVE